jgi:hypothetical protein
MLHVMYVLVRVLRDLRRIEQPGYVKLGRRLRVRREKKVNVITLG